MHIESQTADTVRTSRELLQVGEQGAKNPTLPEFRFHIYTLKPPQVPVAPVAPLVSDHHLTGDGPVDFRNVVKTHCRVLENSANTLGNAVRLQVQVLGFASQAQVEVRNYVGIR
jgi:hypothetical protein